MTFPFGWKWLLSGPAEDRVHSGLVNLEKLNRQQCEVWGELQRYLADEREKKIVHLTDALWNSCIPVFDLSLGSRIVDTDYGDHPLCSVGSIKKPPGGRFNFGPISSFYSEFQSLYIASDYETAFNEKFPLGSPGCALTPEELALARPGSFTHHRVNCSLRNVLDLRTSDSLKLFAAQISSIQIPDHIVTKGLELGLGRIYAVSDADSLRENLLDPNFRQWAFTLDQPSNSQWFGHYTRKAGIEAVLFPSVRSDTGYNLAIYPENLGPASKVGLADPAPYLESPYHVLQQSNHSLFLRTREQMSLAPYN